MGRGRVGYDSFRQRLLDFGDGVEGGVQGGGGLPVNFGGKLADQVGQSQLPVPGIDGLHCMNLDGQGGDGVGGGADGKGSRVGGNAVHSQSRSQLHPSQALGEENDGADEVGQGGAFVEGAGGGAVKDGLIGAGVGAAADPFIAYGGDFGGGGLGQGGQIGAAQGCRVGEGGQGCIIRAEKEVFHCAEAATVGGEEFEDIVGGEGLAAGEHSVEFGGGGGRPVHQAEGFAGHYRAEADGGGLLPGDAGVALGLPGGGQGSRIGSGAKGLGGGVKLLHPDGGGLVAGEDDLGGEGCDYGFFGDRRRFRGGQRRGGGRGNGGATDDKEEERSQGGDKEAGAQRFKHSFLTSGLLDDFVGE